MGHFWVPKTLTFKMRPSAQPFLWKWVLFAWEWKLIFISKAEHLTSFWFRESEMANCGHCFTLLLPIQEVPMNSHFRDKYGLPERSQQTAFLLSVILNKHHQIQAWIHTNFHHFMEISQMFHNKYIFNNRKNFPSWNQEVNSLPICKASSEENTTGQCHVWMTQKPRKGDTLGS